MTCKVSFPCPEREREQCISDEEGKDALLTSVRFVGFIQQSGEAPSGDVEQVDSRSTCKAAFFSILEVKDIEAASAEATQRVTCRGSFPCPHRVPERVGTVLVLWKGKLRYLTAAILTCLRGGVSAPCG